MVMVLAKVLAKVLVQALVQVLATVLVSVMVLVRDQFFLLQLQLIIHSNRKVKILLESLFETILIFRKLL